MNEYDELDPDVFLHKAKDIVQAYYNGNRPEGSAKNLRLHQIYIVWFSKTLDHWKALVSTEIEDGLYYELIYNGQKHETYMDVYSRVRNVCVPDDTFDRSRELLRGLSDDADAKD